MKRFFVILLVGLLGLPALVSAQRASWRSGDDGYWERKNVLSVGISAFSASGLGMGFAPVTIAYDHNLGHNITLGGVIHSSNHFFRIVTDSYEVDDASVFAGVKLGYDLKIARHLRLRFGVGGGVGFHYISDISTGWGYTLPDNVHTPTERALPHFLVDVHWAWRVGRNLELTFAPLVLTPSQLIFHPWDDDYFSGGYYNYNFIPIGLSARF
jgi:hypothetical protein